MIKNILKYVITLFVTISFSLTALVLVSFIPEENIQENITKSAKFLKQQGDERIPFEVNGRITYNDNCTDAIMLNIIYSLDRDNIVESIIKARRNYIPNVSTNFVEDTKGNLKFESDKYLMTHELEKLVNGVEQKSYDYARYWHGYIIILIPLLLLFDVIGVRISLQIILLTFLVILLYFIAKKRNCKYSFIYLISFIALDMFIWINTIQGMFVMILAVIISVFVANGKINSKNINLLLFIIGGLTAYFDFLTVPLVSLLLPLITYNLVNIRDTSLKTEFINFIKNSISWGIGYLGLWTAKWIISDLFFGTDIFKLCIEQIFFRIGTEGYNQVEHLSIWAILYNFAVSVNYTMGALYLITFIICFCTLISKGKKHYFTSQKIYYYLCAIIPIAWYGVIAQHSYQHYFYTYKTLLITLISVMLIVFDNRKKLDKENKKDA